MKNTVKLFAISLLVVLIANCKKKDNGPDLTTNIVGTYTGTFQLNVTSPSQDTTFANQQILVTKASNTSVRIIPNSGVNDGSAFFVNLILSPSGDTIGIYTPMQDINTVAMPIQFIVGGSLQMPPPAASDTNSFPYVNIFVPSAGLLNYNLQVTENGLVANEIFTGSKQ
jgi:hypothetical protein